MPREIIFDLETDGLYYSVSKVHCLVLYILDEKPYKLSFSDTPVGHEAGTIADGLIMLSQADCIIGHNIINYDIPVLKKLYPGWTYIGRVYDTLIASKLAFPCIENQDYARIRCGKPFPPKLIGRYSLESWGWRLGNHKGTYGKTTDWQTYDFEMLDYCEQDTDTNRTLYLECLRRNVSEQALQLEFEVARIITQQSLNGWCFDFKKAEKLYCLLSDRREDLLQQLQLVFPAWEEKSIFIPKRNNKVRGYQAGVPIERIELVPFNPNSSAHVTRALKERYNWVPVEFTEKTGEPVIDDEILAVLPYPEAKLIAEYLMIQKRIGMLAEGKKAWLKLYNMQDGKIHGSIDTLGARTRRMTHRDPNCAQVPASHSPYGAECRELFHAPEGYTQVGMDADALEMRCLAHYMAKYDNGEYVKVVLDGKKEDGTDPHSRNAKALELIRDNAKTWFYAFIYGAGNEKLGRIGSSLDISAGEAKKLGKKRREQFLDSLPALKQLTADVQRLTRERGWLYALDKSILPSPSEHSALNTLLQSAGAVIMKRALVIAERKLSEARLDFKFVGNIHDEFQAHIRNDQVAETCELLLQSIPEAGEYYNFRCPLAGAISTGRNWAETH